MRSCRLLSTAVKDDLLVTDPGDAFVLRKVALPAHAVVAEFGEGPADGVVVRAPALEPDLVSVLTCNQVHRGPVDRKNGGDTPGIDRRVIRSNCRVVRLRLLPGLAPLAQRSNEDVLDHPALEDPAEVPLAHGLPGDVAILVEESSFDI